MARKTQRNNESEGNTETDKTERQSEPDKAEKSEELAIPCFGQTLVFFYRN